MLIYWHVWDLTQFHPTTKTWTWENLFILKNGSQNIVCDALSVNRKTSKSTTLWSGFLITWQIRCFRPPYFARQKQHTFHYLSSKCWLPKRELLSTPWWSGVYVNIIFYFSIIYNIIGLFCGQFYLGMLLSSLSYARNYQCWGYGLFFGTSLVIFNSSLHLPACFPSHSPARSVQIDFDYLILFLSGGR